MNTDSATSRSPSLARREREMQARRRRILKAAEATFSRSGFHKASMTSIARRAGQAAGTTYLYFEDKADLYGVVILEKMTALIDRISEALESSDSPAVCLRAAVESQFAFHEANRQFFEIFLQQHQMDSASLHRRHWERLEDLKRINLSNFEKCIVRGQECGEFRGGDPKLFAVALLGITLQITRQWIREGRSGSLSGSAAFAVECFLFGASQKP